MRSSFTNLFVKDDLMNWLLEVVTAETTAELTRGIPTAKLQVVVEDAIIHEVDMLLFVYGHRVACRLALQACKTFLLATLDNWF